MGLIEGCVSIGEPVRMPVLMSSARKTITWIAVDRMSPRVSSTTGKVPSSGDVIGARSSVDRGVWMGRRLVVEEAVGEVH